MQWEGCADSEVCPLQGGCPFLGGPFIRGSTESFSKQVILLVPTLQYKVTLESTYMSFWAECDSRHKRI